MKVAIAVFVVVVLGVSSAIMWLLKEWADRIVD